MIQERPDWKSRHLHCSSISTFNQLHKSPLTFWAQLSHLQKEGSFRTVGSEGGPEGGTGPIPLISHLLSFIVQLDHTEFRMPLI